MSYFYLMKIVAVQELIRATFTDVTKFLYFKGVRIEKKVCILKFFTQMVFIIIM